MLLLFLCLLPTVVHSFLVSRFPIRQISPRFSANCRTSADLTPAVDKYSVLPDQSHLEDLSRFTLPPPNDDVADPFALVSDDILSLPQYVKEALRNESPVLTMAANHFFEQVSLRHRKSCSKLISLFFFNYVYNSGKVSAIDLLSSSCWGRPWRKIWMHTPRVTNETYTAAWRS